MSYATDTQLIVVTTYQLEKLVKFEQTIRNYIKDIIIIGKVEKLSKLR